MTGSRRRLLASLAAGLALGLGTGWALPRSVHSLLEEIDGASVTTPSTDPVAESETPYAVFQYEPVDGGSEFSPTSPINVVFPLEEASFDDVIDVFRAANWSARPGEYARYAYDRDTETWHRSHWSGAEAVIGVVTRLHVRCWELAGTASIQAHVDTHATPKHRIRSHSAAATAIAQMFAEEGWHVDPDDPETIDLRNARPPDHPGAATVIRR